MITHYVVMHEHSQTGEHIETIESGTPFTEEQAREFADMIVHALSTKAWVEKRVYDYISQETIYIAKP